MNNYKKLINYVQNLIFLTSEYHSSIRLNLTISGSHHDLQKADRNVFYGQFILNTLRPVVELGHRGGIHRVDATSTSIFVILTPSTGGSRWIWKLFESILHRLKYRGGGFLVCGFKILIRFFDRKGLLLVF
jgi:hypothetical protein